MTHLTTHTGSAHIVAPMVEAAARRLAAAGTAAEVLDARDMASVAYDAAKKSARMLAAKNAHDAIIAAAHRAQADALEIEAAAKRRLADEYDAAQERGEVAKDGRPKTVVDDNGLDQRRFYNEFANREGERYGPPERPATAADLGLRRDEIHEARKLRDAELAEPGITRRVLDDALARGEEPTKALVRRELEARPHVANNSGNNEWYTPAEYVTAARAVLGSIDLDPASSEVANRTVGAARFFTAADDGLAQEWPVGRIWMNPPYAQPLIGQFSERFANEISRGSTGIVLVNNATETRWFQTLLSVSSAVCFPSGRVRFVDPQGTRSGAPLQGQAVLYAGQDADGFAAAFQGFGAVLRGAV